MNYFAAHKQRHCVVRRRCQVRSLPGVMRPWARSTAGGRIPGSELTIYHGGHLDLITEAGHLAPVVEAFLTAVNDPQRQPATLDYRRAPTAASERGGGAMVSART